MAPVDLITTTAGVQALADRLRGSRRLALDTEFHAERRYRPQLLLVQIAAEPGGDAPATAYSPAPPEGRAQDPAGVRPVPASATPAEAPPSRAATVHVIDPTCCDLSPLGPLVETVEWVVHGGQHDVGLLARATGTWPRHILDTQRAAALVGVDYPVRLDTLMKQRLGVAFPASQALTNWKQRPLSDQQLRYAAGDVGLLLDLADDLDVALAALGRSDLARAASGELVAEAQAPPRDLDAWRQWTIAPMLSDDERRVLAALSRWRDARARERDQPPHYLLGDSLMLALARRRPSTPAELVADRRVGSGLHKRYGADLLAVIARALAGPPPPAVGEEVPARAHLLRAWVSAFAAQEKLGAGLLLPPPLLQRVAERGPDAVTGWRRSILHAPLSELWAGRTTVGLDPGRGRPSLQRDKRWPAPDPATP